MNTLIETFSTPILVSKYTDDFEEEKKYVSNLECTRENKDGDNFYLVQTEDTFILNDPMFLKLKLFFEDRIKMFMDHVICSPTELTITQSWINKSFPGQCHQEHSHPNSILSGVFYFSLDEDMPHMRFARRDSTNILLEYFNLNDRNNYYRMVPAVTGDLILFPSELRHSVSKNTTDRTRISLSFNTFAKERLGSITSLTYLPLTP